MRKPKKSISIAPFEAARKRFECWRNKRKHRRERTPEKLWRLAVKLAGTYGISRTARTLGLGHDRLKRRVGDGMGVPAPKFVELASRAPLLVGGSVVEVERPGGSKLRVELRGGGTLDVSALTRSFMEARV